MVRPFLCTFFFFAVLLLPRSSGAQEEEQEILILHSYHLGQPWTGGIMKGMQKVLSAQPGVHLEVEYMDTKRYHDPEYLTRLIDTVLSYKLRRRSFDLVLLSDNDALDFALRHRDDFFAGTPIVFCGINNFHPKMIAGHPDMTGVAEVPDFPANMKLIRRLHPKVRRVVVLAGTDNQTDLQNGRLMKAVQPEFPEELEVVFWEDIPWEEMRLRLGDLDKTTAIFINALVQTQGGEIVPYRAAIAEMHRRNPDVPFYGAWDFLLGAGVVGGLVASSERQGELAATLALQILGGRDPDEIPVVTHGADLYMFDLRELKRFRIPENSLPPGSVVIHQPLPFLHLSRETVLLLLGVAVLLLGALGALLVAVIRQRRAERALRASEERFRAIADYTFAWETWIGTDCHLKWVNPSVECQTGYTQAECMEMPDYPLPLIHEEDVEWVRGMVDRALKERTSDQGTIFRIRRKDGEVRWMSASWLPIHGRNGEWLGLRASLHDVTERYMAECHLREVNEELDAFVRTVSHDLRSHLTPVIGFAEFLLKQYGPGLDGTAREALGEILRQGERVHGMLEDLLALSRVGYAPIPQELLNAQEVLEDVLIALAPRFAEAGLQAILHQPLPPAPLPRVLLVQAMENLLSNAVRYGRGGEGAIEVGGETEGKRCVRFYVRDHGPGVPDAEKEKIFDLFYRGSSPSEIAGTGVGLATVRRIARRYGGKAWVTDTPGGGATFWIEVEARNPEEENIPICSL